MDKESVRQIESKTGHALFSPSQLSRIMACPASAQLALKVPVQKSSPYAQRGTKLHDIVANLLVSPGTPADDSNPMLSKLDIIDMNQVLDCLEYLDGIRKDFGEHEMLVEKSVSLTSWGVGDIWGTADVQLINPHRMHVIDWKFGSGVQVYAQNNEQGLAYAAGAVGFPSRVEEIVIHVVQPPLNHFDEWVLSYQELKDWVFDILTPAIIIAQEKNPPFNPGPKQCKFCPGSTKCKARDEDANEQAKVIFSTYSDLPTVSPDRLVKSLHAIQAVQAYAKDIQVFCQLELEKGREIPGYKLVSGRSQRKWRDQDAAEAWLLGNSSIKEEDMYKKKFFGPAGAEKIDRKLKKDDEFKTLIEKPPGKAQLVSDEDPRPALKPKDAASAFSDVK